jgi:hypothetical protein
MWRPPSAADAKRKGAGRRGFASPSAWNSSISSFVPVYPRTLNGKLFAANYTRK